MNPELLQGIFDRAKNEELGICIETNNPKALKQVLEGFQAEAPSLQDLKIVSSVRKNELFITHESQALE